MGAQTAGEMVGMMQKNADKMTGNAKSTEVHPWVQNGKGEFNYRMIWPMLYNLDNLVDKKMRLQIKVYDYDIGKDDLIGETQLNIEDMLTDAFKNRERNRMIRVGQPFRIAEGALKDWKLTFDLKKKNHNQGSITLSIVVYDNVVAMLEPGRRQHGFVGAGRRSAS